MDYRVDIIDKNGIKTSFRRIVLNIVIDRRIDMQTASATIVIQDVKNRVPKLYNFTGMDGIIANGNYIYVYVIHNGIEKIEFTGIIRDFEIDGEAKTININCHDIGCKILRPIDGGIPFHVFNNITATQLISNMTSRAGLGTPVFDIVSSNNYTIKNLKMQYDVQISDIIDEALKTLEARARVLKNGTYKVEKLYPSYKVENVENNTNYNWYYEDFIRIGKLNRKRGSETLYNRVLVRHADNSYNVFKEPSMIKYLGYINFKEIDSPLGDTLAKRQRIASRFFLDGWRQNSNVDIVATKGNPDLDLGQIIRLALDGKAVGHYMATGIRTELDNTGNYTDQIALDGMREVTNIAELSSGNYTIEKKSEKKSKKRKNETYENVKENILQAFRIDKTGKIKLGFVDIEKQPYLEVKAFFNSLLETKHYDLIIEDPNKSFYGYKQQILGDHEKEITKTSLNSCQSIIYSGWSGQPEYFKINKPMPGRWYIYLQSDTNEEYKVNISVNMLWKKVKIDEV